MRHWSGLWLCEHLIWRTPSLPSLLPVPHKDGEGVETRAAGSQRKWGNVLHCIQALFLLVPTSTLVLLVAVPWLVLPRLALPCWWLPTGEWDWSRGSGNPKLTAGITGHRHTSLALAMSECNTVNRRGAFWKETPQASFSVASA